MHTHMPAYKVVAFRIKNKIDVCNDKDHTPHTLAAPISGQHFRAIFRSPWTSDSAS